MQRRYEVYVAGKPLVIAGTPSGTTLPEHWMAQGVGDAREVAEAVEWFSRSPELRGLYLYPKGGLDVWAAFQAGYTVVQAAGGLVLDQDGRLLVIKRLGRWDLPKGKVDPGEAIRDAALREVREECGLRTLELIQPIAVSWHTYPHKGHQVLKRTDWFLMRGDGQEPLVPQHDEGIDVVRWASPHEAEVLRAETYPSLVPVLDVWLDRRGRPG
jgi:8-oxo-dGTP pyrophosphatase MutT (NUDIX family)